jgi:ABC-type nickel/cobalt efflux system permease component RcnA
MMNGFPRTFFGAGLRLVLGLAIAGVAMLVLTEGPAVAQTKPPSAFGAPSPQQSPPPAFGKAATPKAAPLRAKGPFGSVLSWVAQTQQKMQRQLATAVKNLKSGNAVGAALFLAGLSFAYGVVHAVGPGHGKAIISSYVVANEETVRRGILISFLAAALQALTAVALVSVLLVALSATGLQVNAWTNQLETVSYGMIALVGLYLLVTELIRLWRRWRAPQETAPVQAHNHDHHDHDHAHGHDHHHHAAHHHDDGEACNHMVDAADIAGPLSWRKVVAVVVSVGIRPCSGAILVLVFALTQGLFWAGVAATFAMAFGTAITVAVLATLALGSRELVLKLGGGNQRWVDAVWTTCAIGGALVVLMAGLLLFAASLGPARPF